MTDFKQHKESNYKGEKRRKVLKTASLTGSLLGAGGANLSRTSLAAHVAESASNLEFSTSINGVEVCGSTDSSLSSASNALLVQSSIVKANFEGRDNGYSASFTSVGNGLSGYSACWSAGENNAVAILSI